MANHKSAEKRIRQTEKRTAINRSRMSRVRTFVKKVETAIATGDKARGAISPPTGPARTASGDHQGRDAQEHGVAQAVAARHAHQRALNLLPGSRPALASGNPRAFSAQARRGTPPSPSRPKNFLRSLFGRVAIVSSTKLVLPYSDARNTRWRPVNVGRGQATRVLPRLNNNNGVLRGIDVTRKIGGEAGDY